MSEPSDQSGLEDRLGRALHAGAEVDPDPGGLAARARSRAAARRRTRSRMMVGAVVLAVVAAVVPLALLRGDGSGADVAASPAVDDEWRTITRSGLTLEVPSTWDDDVVREPCPPTADCYFPAPSVLVGLAERPRERYSAPELSGGAWRASLVHDGTSLVVTTADRPSAQRVVDSAYGGCAPTSGLDTRKGEAPVIPGLNIHEPDVLCTYERRNLVGKVRLDPEDSAALVRALQAAPVSAGGVACDGIDRLDGRATRVRFGEAEVWIGPDCGTGGVRDGTATRDLTDGVRAALSPSTWQTVEVEGVTLDLPGDWVRLDTGACRAAAVRFGPADTDPCAASAPLSLTGTRAALIDGPPGLGAGFVLTGDQMVSVGPGDPEIARRVLASVRVLGEAATGTGDLDAPWVEQEHDGATWRQPMGAAIRVRIDRSASCETGNPQNPAFPDDDGRWQAEHCADRVVVVTGPTRALTDLVTSTVDDTGADARAAVDAWRTVSASGALIDVPSDWVRLDISTCSELVVDPEGARFGPAGTAPCARAVPVDVFGTNSLQAGALAGPGYLSPPGLAFTGDAVVVARGDLETRRRVLSSVRRPGEDPGDLTVPWEEVTRDGATWQQPVGADVEVTLVDADIRCRDVDYAATTPTGDRRWRGTYCVDRGATVTAPTEALADMVGSTVRSDVQ